MNKSKTFKDPCGWGSSTIVHILKKREYLGHTVNFKTRKHFKDKKSRYPDGWGEAHPLTGLLYCADCGGKMYVHHINAEVVMTLVADMLKAIAEYSKNDRAEFIRTVQGLRSSSKPPTK